MAYIFGYEVAVLCGVTLATSFFIGCAGDTFSTEGSDGTSSGGGPSGGSSSVGGSGHAGTSGSSTGGSSAGGNSAGGSASGGSAAGGSSSGGSSAGGSAGQGSGGAGATCSADAPCEGGTCQGESCNETWSCNLESQGCTKDLAAYCGCDGETFQASSTCPSRPWLYAGPCEEGANCDTGQVTCERLEPQCPEGEVPSVKGTCYGPCVPITSCHCTVAEQCPKPDQYTCHLTDNRCGPYLQ